MSRWAGWLVVAVLVTGSAGTHKSRSLTLPETVDEYSRLSTISGTQLRGLFSSGGGATFGVIPPEDLAAAIHQRNAVARAAGLI